MANANDVSRISDAYVVSPANASTFQGYEPKVIVNTASLLAKGSTSLFGICIDNAGVIYVSDPVRHAIYKVTQNGSLALYAGEAGTSGNNGSSVVTLANARFNAPAGLACDQYGNLYVADSYNYQIRKITPDGRVSLIAGDPSVSAGFVDGTAAKFRLVRDLALDNSGNLYIADTGNHCIRKMRAGTNNVITIAGKGNTSGDVLGAGGTARFDNPVSICVDAAGVCFIADANNYKVKKMDQDGNVTLVVGAGSRGTTVGTYATSKFLDMLTITTDRSRNLYLVDNDDSSGARLMKISYNGACKTVYNFNTTPTDSGTYAVGVDVDRSGKFFVVESRYADRIYSYTSSSSTNSSSSTSSSSTGSSLSSRSSLSS